MLVSAYLLAVLAVLALGQDTTMAPGEATTLSTTQGASEASVTTQTTKEAATTTVKSFAEMTTTASALISTTAPALISTTTVSDATTTKDVSSVGTNGPAVAEKRVQTTEAIDSTSQQPTPVPSSRSPKYVDLDSMRPNPELGPPPSSFTTKPVSQNITVRLENLACRYPHLEQPALTIDIEKTFQKLSENISEVRFNEGSCKTYLTLNLTVTATDGDFKKLLSKLEEHVKNITVADNMLITAFTLHDGGEHSVSDVRPLGRPSRFPTYREELIILIAVIILLIIVLFIGCVICSIKCCRRTPSAKTLDMLDSHTPHSRSISDYATNRIPRPHTLYSPTASEYSGCLSPMTPYGPGVVQPFDTCLVPLEDVTPSGVATCPVTGATGRPVRPNNLPIRQRVDFSPDKARFRSYNYPPRHTRTLPSGLSSKNYRSANASQSTEQLTKNHSMDDDSGVDNPTYLPTPSTPHGGNTTVTSDIAETHKM